MISMDPGSLPKRLSRHPYGAKEGNACTSALAMSGSPLLSTYSRGVAVEVYGRKAQPAPGAEGSAMAAAMGKTSCDNHRRCKVTT